MRTVTLKTLLASVAALHNGQVLASVPAGTLASFAETLTAALRYAWNWAEWPELCRVRERSPESGLVTWQEAGQPLMGTVLDVTQDDPNTTRSPRSVVWRHDQNGEGIRVFGVSGSVFVKFLPAAPEVTTQEWAAETTYSTGELVYDNASGNCYESLSDDNTNHEVSNGSYWRPVLLPWIFRTAAPRGANAIRAATPGGQVQSAALLQRNMDELLAMESEQFRSRGGQVQHYGVVS